MSTYTQLLYQIVFSTKNRERTMIYENQEKLYRYIWGILKKKNCHLYRINGVEDHIHLITHIHPSISLSQFVKDIKLASSKYIKSENIFPDFTFWQEGYAAFTYPISAKDNLINYVKHQKEHHKKCCYKDELKALLQENKIEYDEKYLL